VLDGEQAVEPQPRLLVPDDCLLLLLALELFDRRRLAGLPKIMSTRGAESAL